LNLKMDNRVGILFAMLFAILIHVMLAEWFLSLAQPEPIKPVTLVSIEWLDAPPPIQSPSRVVIEPPIIEPEPVVSKEVAPPPKPIVPKPVAKPIVRKEPVVVQKPPVSEAVTESSKPAAVIAPTQAIQPIVQAQADYLNNPKPNYPRISKRISEQGEVRLKVQISAEGNVLNVALAKSSGFERLDEAAISSVKTWKFKPAKQGDTAITSWVEVPVKFILED
jgi:protein TonB